MKKIFMAMALCLVCSIITSCDKKVETNMELTLKDGVGNDVKCLVICNESVAELFFDDLDSYEGLVRMASSTMKYLCNYPPTFVPESFTVFGLEKTDDVYTVVVLVDGRAKNGFGVEGQVSEFIHLKFRYK